MIEELKPYERYRPTGLDVAPRTPSHWEILPVGRIGRFLRGQGGTKKDNADHGVPCIRYGDIYKHFAFHITRAHSFVHQGVSSRYTKLRRGDVVFALSGERIDEIGASAEILLDGDVVGGGDMAILRPARETAPGFLGYALRATPAATQKAREGTGTTVKHTSVSALRGVLFGMPPLDEQEAIVRFLDHANRRIDQFILSKKKLIALLTEQKQAIIHLAVTRGTGSHGTPIVPRTGQHWTPVTSALGRIPWLFEIPAGWKIMPSGQLFEPRKELARDGDEQLSATQAYGVIHQAEFERRVGRRVVKISMHLEKRRHVERDDFVMSMRSFQGGLERAWVSGCIRSSYVVLRPRFEIDTGYFAYLFKSTSYIRALQATANFIRDGQDLNFDNFRLVELPLPPVEVQRAIADHIDGSTAGLTKGVEKARQEIRLLAEYRTRLVADVVTGQLDVRAAAEGLPVVEPEAAPTESEGDETDIEVGEAT